MKRVALAWVLAAIAVCGTMLRPAGARDAMPDPPRPSAPVYPSPLHLAISADGATAFVLEHQGDRLAIVDLAARRLVREVPLGNRPTHAVLADGGARLFVTLAHEGTVAEVDTTTGEVLRRIPVGFEPYGIAASADGTRLWVTRAQADALIELDLPSGLVRGETPTGREPREVAPTPDGARLVVGDSLGRSVTVVDPAGGSPPEHRTLGRASLVRGVAVSRDGRWAFAAHIVSHDEALPVQIERGWIHSNGISVLDLARPGHYVTLLLDRLLDGAAYPWGLALSDDGTRLFVALAGVHEVAIVDVAAALALVEETGPERVKALAEDVEIVARRGIARRVDSGGLGPRGIAYRACADEVVVANYFSDDLSILDGVTGAVKARIPLGPHQAPTLHRRGELLFNDARICYQHWFNCASCHQEDAGTDALTWDLPNDGLGNPKNSKSLRDIHDTPPAMWSGVRETMEEAVAAGQRFQGFLPVAANHAALMAFLAAPPRPPNPHRGTEPEAVRRGERLFRQARCSACHPAPLYTDLRRHDLGLTGDDTAFSRIDTPSLREVYRTGPWLHDGRARSLHDVFRVHDPLGRHGRTAGLSAAELDDLIAFLRSL